jgi:transcriptional regulator with XRE-family HTH domain
MSRKTVAVMPQTRDILEQMGEQIRMARLRRRISAGLAAERAGISRQTLNSIEKGTPTVSIGSYAAVLHALNGMDSDLLLIAKDDKLGRKLQDLQIAVRKRAPKKGKKHGSV